MGIRVNKIIGYGLDDVKVEKYKIIDPRINPDFDRGESFYDKLEKFPDWIIEFHEKMAYMLHATCKVDIKRARWDLTMLANSLKRHKEEGRYTYGTGFIHQVEFGMPEVMMFVPVDNMGSWARHDDTVDWIEETHFHNQENRVVNLFKETGSCGIYPYTGMIVNPFKENKMAKSRLDGQEYNVLAGRWAKGVSPTVSQETLEHLQKDWLPVIPSSVLAMCMYLNVFKHPKYIFDLRPMFYVYWA